MSPALTSIVVSRSISLAVTCCVLLACFSAPEAVVARVPTTGAAHTVRLGREFKLRPGQQASLKGTKLRVTFMNVKEDSRCPSNVTCVWAGNGAVRLWVSNGKGGEALILNTQGGPSLVAERHYKGFKIKLVALAPYPRTDRPIAAGDYTSTLLISKQ